MEVVFESVIREKFINQHPLASCNAIPNKGHKVTVMDTADNLNLCLEFAFSLPTAGFQALHGDFLPVRQNPFMYIPESSLTQQVRLSESCCCHG